ncbi:MAG: hypothetical protein WBA93_17605 [Microcoleaceae cyanobacterium]
MREVLKKYPDDLDAAILFAESLMDLTPWNYWKENGAPQVLMNEIVYTLKFVLEKNQNHPEAIHYYIHALEASPNSEKAETAADSLHNLVPIYRISSSKFISLNTDKNPQVLAKYQFST